MSVKQDLLELGIPVEAIDTAEAAGFKFQEDGILVKIDQIDLRKMLQKMKSDHQAVDPEERSVENLDPQEDQGLIATHQLAFILMCVCTALGFRMAEIETVMEKTKGLAIVLHKDRGKNRTIGGKEVAASLFEPELNQLMHVTGDGLKEIQKQNGS